jgi:hypothetical protein
MNDEQPTFKVTDRRLFNADGSPRELPQEEPSATQPSQAVDNAQQGGVTSATSIERDISSGGFSDSAHLDDELSAEELEGVNEPASFVNFVMSIASNAAAALGMMEHPVTHERDVDLELGKHWIDVLGMLEKKTKGNLTTQEQKMLEGLLSDLRMQFVSLANATQKPKTFSGRDITGGR